LYGNWSPFLGLPGKGLFVISAPIFNSLFENKKLNDITAEPNFTGGAAVMLWHCYSAKYP